MLLLDTMALIWLVNGEAKLGRKARSRIESARDGVGFSVISLFEIGLLIAKRRIAIDVQLPAWRLALIRNGLVEEPVSGAIALIANELGGLPNDPADRLITATAVARGATLVTSDEIILGWVGDLKRLNARR